MALIQDDNFNAKKISGHFETWDPTSGRKIEGETRSCVHCGRTWIPKQRLFDIGSNVNTASTFSKTSIEMEQGAVRGYCTTCNGHVCGTPACIKAGCVPMLKKVELIEKISNQHGRRELPLIGA